MDISWGNRKPTWFMIKIGVSENGVYGCFPVYEWQWKVGKLLRDREILGYTVFKEIHLGMVHNSSICPLHSTSQPPTAGYLLVQIFNICSHLTSYIWSFKTTDSYRVCWEKISPYSLLYVCKFKLSLCSNNQRTKAIVVLFAQLHVHQQSVSVASSNTL